MTNVIRKKREKMFTNMLCFNIQISNIIGCRIRVPIEIQNL